MKGINYAFNAADYIVLILIDFLRFPPQRGVGTKDGVPNF